MHERLRSVLPTPVTWNDSYVAFTLHQAYLPNLAVSEPANFRPQF
ncbi:hypothetical protein [Stenomitos frigidus]|nr:hypothetical protein [Stenomitos frigidus]